MRGKRGEGERRGRQVTSKIRQESECRERKRRDGRRKGRKGTQ